MKWTRTASDEDKEGATDVGFLAAPGPVRQPAARSGDRRRHDLALWPVGRDDGKTVWKSYLCDEPQGGAAPWSPVAIAVDGREAYLTCRLRRGLCRRCGRRHRSLGHSLPARRQAEQHDAADVRQAVRRHARSERLGRRRGHSVRPGPGRACRATATSCSRSIAARAICCGNRPALPRSAPSPVIASACNGRGLFVAGKNVVRRYDIAQRPPRLGKGNRRFVRPRLRDGRRGLCAREGFDRQVRCREGREIVQVGVALTSDDPVGNLFSDGEKLWVVGAGRVYAMTTLEHRMKILAEQIAAGDAEAQLNRMRLLCSSRTSTSRHWPTSAAPTRCFQASFRPTKPPSGCFAAIQRAQAHQQAAARSTRSCLTERSSMPASPPQLAKETIGRRNGHADQRA